MKNTLSSLTISFVLLTLIKSFTAEACTAGTGANGVDGVPGLPGESGQNGGNGNDGCGLEYSNINPIVVITSQQTMVGRGGNAGNGGLGYDPGSGGNGGHGGGGYGLNLDANLESSTLSNGSISNAGIISGIGGNGGSGGGVYLGTGTSGFDGDPGEGVGINLFRNGTITSLSNSSQISGVGGNSNGTIASGGQGVGITVNRTDVNVFTNDSYGSITGTGGSGGSVLGDGGSGLGLVIVGSSIFQVINNGLIEGVGGTPGQSGTMGSGAGIFNLGGSVGLIDNSGVIQGNAVGIENAGSIEIINNKVSGIITATAIGVSDSSAAIGNEGLISKIDNQGDITGDGTYGIVNFAGASTHEIINRAGATISGSYSAIENLEIDSVIGSISNSGTIVSGADGIVVLNYGTLTTLTNNNGGLITGSDGAWGVVNAFSMDTLINNGTISVTSSGGTAVYNHNFWGGSDTPTLTNLVNNGTISTASGGSDSSAAIGNEGLISKIDNQGDITGDGAYGIVNFAGASTHEIINRAGATISGRYAAIENYEIDSVISSISNSGTIISNASNGSGGNVIFNYGTLTTLTNNSGGLMTGSGGAYGVINAFSMDTLINNGTISVTGSGSIAVYNYNYWGGSNTPTLANLVNNGTISSDDDGIYNEGTITSITNTGNISSANESAITNYSGTITTLTNNLGATISGSSYGLFNAGGTIGTINNAGAISSGTSDPEFAIRNWGTIGSLNNSGSINGYIGIENWIAINTLTNTGSITGPNHGIVNYGTISTINNLQGAGNANGALTLYQYLPTNYNIIINDTSHYGQLSVTLSGIEPSGITTFGISSLSGRNIGTTGTRYQNVISGVGASLIANQNTTLNYQNGNLTATYQLVDDDASVADTWDLLILSMINGPSATDTQSSLHSLASKLRGGFSGQTVVTNFANMNTYDCDLFDEKGVCVSVGGQQTYVDNPSANLTSTVVVTGYKVSPNIRIGGFLNQNINNNTVSGVHISNANPLMGLFAVWNQNEDRLGYQVKIANAYQDKDVTTTRDVVGTSEAGTGKTNLNTQSYVGELSYAFLANEEKTLVRPYAAIRYTSIKQDGYTEQTSAGVTAPLTYSAIEDRSTSALLGVKLNHKLAEKVNLTGSLGIEQDMYHHVDNLTATGVADLTSENFNGNIKRTRPVASIGAYYMPVKNQRIAADLYYQQLPFQSTASTTAYVNYTIGF